MSNPSIHQRQESHSIWKSRERTFFFLSLKNTNVLCFSHLLAIAGVLEMRKGHVEQARAFFQVIIVALLQQHLMMKWKHTMVIQHTPPYYSRFLSSCNFFDWGGVLKQVMQKNQQKNSLWPPLPQFIILLSLFLEHFPHLTLFTRALQVWAPTSLNVTITTLCLVRRLVISRFSLIDVLILSLPLICIIIIMNASELVKFRLSFTLPQSKH